MSNRDNGLVVPIGTDDDGRIDSADLSNDAILLVSGPPRTGKSTAVRRMLTGLLATPPEQVRVAVIDTGDEYGDFVSAPHLIADPAADPRQGISILQEIAGEVDSRLHHLASRGARRLQDLDNPPPQLVVIVDELLPLLRTDGVAATSLLVRLATRSRAAGVHIILVLSGSIAALGDLASNVTEQIAFDRDLVSGATPSPSILPVGRLELGEFLWEPMEATYPVRRRSIPTSSLEIRTIVDRWSSRL